jgi:thiamine-monophosphate kinase
VKESEFHDWLRRTVPSGEGVFVGIGDDAAVVAGADRIAVASDLMVEGVHFRVQDAPPARIGAKAVNRNFSDMAAMGLKPLWILASAALPERTPEAFVCSLVQGMLDAAQAFDVHLVGGDTSASKAGLVIDVAVIGKVGKEEPLTRAGARPGDRILVTGELGGSSRGRHLDFTPRVKEGVFLNRHHRPSSMIDVSDGLALDLHRILDASSVGARLMGGKIPCSRDAGLCARTSGKSPLEHALSDGEDFELLFTLSPQGAEALLRDGSRFFEVTEIGEVLPDKDERTLDVGGRIRTLGREGYDHTL